MTIDFRDPARTGLYDATDTVAVTVRSGTRQRPDKTIDGPEFRRIQLRAEAVKKSNQRDSV
jgi:hypothetical protein